MDNSNYLATASLDDMVFEGRNKEYGAYRLRKIYNTHINRAIVIAIVLFVIALGAPVIRKALFGDSDVVKAPPKITVVDLEAPPSVEKVVPPPPPPPDAPPPPPPVRSTIKFTPPVVKRDEEVREEEIPDQEQLKEVDAGTETVKGDPNAPPTLEGIDEGTGPVEEVFEDKVYVAVEKMPEFPGGQDAMYKYLQKNYRVPSAALRAGVEGTVVLSIVVGPTGEVSDVQILKKLGYGLDEEAVRVVKSMPRWNPGEQNGRKVSVKYTIPYRIAIK